MAEPVEWAIRVIGAEQAANAMRRVERAAEGVGTSTQAAGQKAATSGRSFEALRQKNAKLGRQVGSTVNVVGELGFSLGTVIPSLRNAGTQMAIAGGTAFQMGSQFGLAGAAAGTLIGVIPALIGALDDTQKEMKETKKDTDEATKSLSDFIAEVRKAQEAEARRRRIEAGVADPETFLAKAKEVQQKANDARDAFVDQFGAPSEALIRFIEEGDREAAKAFSKQFENASAALERARSIVDTQREALRLRRKAAEVREQDIAAQKAREEGKELAEEDPETFGEGGSGGRGGRRGAEDSDGTGRPDVVLERSKQRASIAGASRSDVEVSNTLDEIEQIIELERQRVDEEERLQRAKERTLRMVAEDRRLLEGQKVQLQSISKQLQENLRDLQAEADAAARAAQEQREEQADRIKQGFGEATDFVVGLGEAIASNQEEAVAAFLKAQAKAWALQALEQTALGIATLISNPPESGTHFAAAGLFAGLAAAAGAGSAAAGGGSSKGGQAQAQGPGTAPEGTGGGRDRGSGTTVVQINSPVPEVELGRTIERARRAAQRVGAAA